MTRPAPSALITEQGQRVLLRIEGRHYELSQDELRSLLGLARAAVEAVESLRAAVSDFRVLRVREASLTPILFQDLRWSPAVQACYSQPDGLRLAWRE